MVNVENVTKLYGNFTALDDISFTVNKGEVVGLLGPNGAGKTTTMRIITCFMPTTSGKITVGGYDVFTQSDTVRERIGYMPENVPLYPEMRVIEYLRYRGKLKGIYGRTLSRRLDMVLENCGLAAQSRRIIGHLSKGNRQRVGLAEALIGDPELLILDEPTIGLDPNQVRNFRSLIRDIGNERTVILSTHILSEVEVVCERVIIMHQGTIAHDASLREIHHPRNAKQICEIKANAKEAQAAFSSLPVKDMRSEPLENGWCRVTCRPQDEKVDIRPSLATLAVQKTWEIRRLDTHSPSLEDIFVRITAK